ncbi:hypothetical protein ACTXT7_005499 [Hymenolepis weldensis]
MASAVRIYLENEHGDREELLDPGNEMELRSEKFVPTKRDVDSKRIPEISNENRFDRFRLKAFSLWNPGYLCRTHGKLPLRYNDLSRIDLSPPSSESVLSSWFRTASDRQKKLQTLVEEYNELVLAVNQGQEATKS